MATDLERPSESSKGGLSSYLSSFGAWAFALGTSIGWGSLVVTGNTYLAQAGPYGSIIGLVLGMCIMLVIAASYHFLINNQGGTGGIYAYARDLFGYDHAALVAWFLALVYAAMLWANATSLQLFSRFFLGNLFQFGFHYQLFGYDIYMGEALLSIVAVVLAGSVCTLHKRGVSVAMITMCVVITIGITVCFAGAMGQIGHTSFSIAPKFMPDSSPLGQILIIASISSWAFIGFEGITTSTEEFAFNKKKAFGVLAVALITATALYSFVILLSVSAFPPEYRSWVGFIADLSNHSGTAAVPAFYAALYYLGSIGPSILMAVLLCLVFTSLIGNIVALSRLIYAVAEDGLIPQEFAKINDNGVPSRAIGLILAISAVIPFLGRTAIGWVVDVTTLGATLIYGFVSICAFKDGRARHNKVETVCGVVGLVFMAIFGAGLLLPAVFESDAMATESYFIFTVWSVLGFVCFRLLLQRDTHRLFGRSVVAWVVLLALVLCMSAAWMSKLATTAADESLTSILKFEAGAVDAATRSLGEEVFITRAINHISNTIGIGAVAIAALCMFSFSVMLSNFSIVQRREEESHQKANTAREIANTDPLTGVKSKHAYVTRETEINNMIEDGLAQQLGVVVCDVNGLKQVNDTQGHKAGDAYIRSASHLICNLFKHSPVYRIGGDEFVVLLQGEDYACRAELMQALNERVEENRDRGEVVVAAGLAELTPGVDREVHAVFERADALMYQRKIQLKRPGEEVR